jgi:hypothetical protein
MFSLTDLDLDNAPVIQPVPEGTYRVRIVDLAIYDQREPKTGRYMTCALDVVDVPSAETVRHFISMLPDKGTSEKDAIRAKSRIKQFFDKFGLPYSLQPVEGDGKATFPEAVGREAVVLLGLKAAQNGGEENNVKNLNPPTPAS